MATANSGAQVMAWFEGKVRRLNDGKRNTAKELSKDGEELTKEFIATRGTAKSGKRGRIETGAMIDSVSSGTVKETEDEIVTRFGYEDSPFYTAFQEPGFTHSSGVQVAGTYALSDAAEAIGIELKRDIGRVVRKA